MIHQVWGKMLIFENVTYSFLLVPKSMYPLRSEDSFWIIFSLVRKSNDFFLFFDFFSNLFDDFPKFVLPWANYSDIWSVSIITIIWKFIYLESFWSICNRRDRISNIFYFKKQCHVFINIFWKIIFKITALHNWAPAVNR